MTHSALVFCSILVLFCYAGAQESMEECKLGVRDRCVTPYFHGILGHEGDPTLFCRAVTHYMECIKSTTCQLPAGYQNTLKADVEEQLHNLGIPCDLSKYEWSETPAESASSGISSSKTEACHAGTKKCGTDYAINLSMHKGNVHLICQDVSLYFKCFFALECGFSDLQKKAAVQAAHNVMASKGVYCHIDPYHVATRKPLAPGVTASPCLSATGACLSTSTSEITDLNRKQPNNLKGLCIILVNYAVCLKKTPCPFDKIQTMINTQTQFMSSHYGLNCDVDTANQENHNSYPDERRVNQVGQNNGRGDTGYGPGYQVHWMKPVQEEESPRSGKRNAASMGPVSSLALMTVISVFFMALTRAFE